LLRASTVITQKNPSYSHEVNVGVPKPNENLATIDSIIQWTLSFLNPVHWFLSEGSSHSLRQFFYTSTQPSMSKAMLM